MTKTLVLGLGNPILTDDGVGVRVIEALRSPLAGRADIDVDVDYWGGLHLMERMIGYDRAIVVDAIVSGAEPGSLLLLHPDSVPTQHSASAHDASLATALELGRRLGAHLPRDRDVLLLGIEAVDVATFGESCTPAVARAVPRAVAAVLAAVARRDSRPG